MIFDVPIPRHTEDELAGRDAEVEVSLHAALRDHERCVGRCDAAPEYLTVNV